MSDKVSQEEWDRIFKEDLNYNLKRAIESTLNAWFSEKEVEELKQALESND